MLSAQSLDDALGYVTNVYTRPAYRGRGIGTRLMSHVLQWAREHDLESLIVWPSETSVRFYAAPYQIGEGWIATLADPDGNYFQLMSPMG